MGGRNKYGGVKNGIGHQMSGMKNGIGIEYGWYEEWDGNHI